MLLIEIKNSSSSIAVFGRWDWFENWKLGRRAWQGLRIPWVHSPEPALVSDTFLFGLAHSLAWPQAVASLLGLQDGWLYLTDALAVPFCLS